MLRKLDSRVFGGTMLIAGTTIGAGMLAMPVMTGLFGFWGTLVIMIATWLFMYWTSTLILEATLQFAEGASFISMARATLGKVGAGITWLVFLLLFYALVAAYVSGSGNIIIDALASVFEINIPPVFDLLPLLVIFAPVIYFGLSLVDHLNRWLMIGMLLSYAVIIAWLLPDINWDLLAYTDGSFALLSFSVVVTSFGYQVIIPTLVTYLDRDVKRVKLCMFYGSMIPLVAYILWESSILGVLPVAGAHGLAHAFGANIPLAKMLEVHVGNHTIAMIARCFSMFAIITSFLGVAQGLFDFLKDGIKAGRSHRKRLLAFFLTFIPPVLLLLGFEHGFIALLEYAGALVSIILGIIPILIVWRLRVMNKEKRLYQAPGNAFALVLGIIYFSFVVLIVLLKNLGIINFAVAGLV